jgi:hypothetical protein
MMICEGNPETDATRNPMIASQLVPQTAGVE